ncbi:protein of unknown function [Rathayibacter oskolensis]|uniref:HNH nuclease domain-containing protein n=1 Tax=Rathayibacter oskolensis TaxID=1891671 RepID=A0A1X7PH01_9MICO|nr:HNH endonuclease signature motif containing protein [Rathayibacter oskolensis]SMH50606.1 protein of unknown function [Rathayibacter oskolensis]
MTADGQAVLGEVRTRGDRAAHLARSAAPVLLSAAEELHAGYRAALSCPEAFARGRSRVESPDLVERSIRAEFAVALGVSERVAARELEHAELLVEHLPLTREALAAARLRWEAGQAICAIAATLPAHARAEFDARAAELATAMTPTQLRRALLTLREELHDRPLTERHALAREHRTVWLTPGLDGMSTICATLPAAAAVGAYGRVDRIARALREAADGTGDQRTLAQLRADALTELLCDGEIAGTTPPDGTDRPAPTFVRGIRSEVRLTVPATTAAGLDETTAHLDGYGPIPADVARELAASATAFHRVLTDPDTGTVVSVGRTQRVPPREMRIHLQLRDQTCRFPGCTRPASSAEADHTLEWRNGGDTALDNLASLCTAHHHVRHGDRWTYALRPDGTAEWTTPTGRSHTTHPPALPGRPPPGPPADAASPS